MRPGVEEEGVAEDVVAVVDTEEVGDISITTMAKIALATANNTTIITSIMLTVGVAVVREVEVATLPTAAAASRHRKAAIRGRS